MIHIINNLFPWKWIVWKMKPSFRLVHAWLRNNRICLTLMSRRDFSHLLCFENFSLLYQLNRILFQSICLFPKDITKSRNRNFVNYDSDQLAGYRWWGIWQIAYFSPLSSTNQLLPRLCIGFLPLDISCSHLKLVRRDEKFKELCAHWF